MKRDVKGRRQLVAGLGAAATAVAIGTRTSAQTPAAFSPARHAQDEWIGQIPGKHRVVLDITSPDGMPDGIRFAGNLFSGHQSGYSVAENELALIIVLRHSATVMGYTNAFWAKYGKAMDSRAATPPTANPYDSGERVQLSALAKRGVQFMVCGTASRGISRRIAGDAGNADAIFKEMEASLIPNARLVAAGVIGATRAQEYGFSYLYVG